MNIDFRFIRRIFTVRPLSIGTLLVGLVSLPLDFSANAQDLDKATQQLYLENLEDPDFFEIYAIRDVYLQEADSTTATRLTNTPAAEESPALSKDRKVLVFCSGGLYRLQLKTREFMQLVGEKYLCMESQWVPDTRKISFTGDTTMQSHFNEHRDVFVIDATGGNPRNVTNTPDINEFGHDWSPDGTRLSSIESGSGNNGKYRVWVQSENEPSERFVAAEFDSGVSKTAWSSDGKKIYCSLRVNGFAHSLVYIDIASGRVEQTPVTNLDYDQWDVSSAYGRFATAKREAVYEIGDVHTVFPSHIVAVGKSPRWVGDGECLVFTRKAFPENFIEDVKRAKHPKDYRMVVIRKDGTMDFRTDVFDNQSPIVTELPAGAKREFSGQYQNLSRSEAAALLDKNKSLQESIRVEYFEWEVE